MSLFSYVRRHTKAFLFTVVVLVCSGIAATLRLPISLFPDVTFPRIVILADNGEEPAERMMIEVTKPLEEAASSIPGVRTVRSVTGRGATEISVGMEWGTNVLQTLQVLQGRIGNIRNELPAAASVQAEQMMVSVFPILGYSLTSEKLSSVELRDIALYQIRPALLRIQGIARVEVTGGDTREFRVTVSPEKLNAYHLDIRQVSEAIRATNLLTSSGLIDNNFQLYLSLVSGQLITTDDIKAVVVSAQNGVPIRVQDVADVAPSVADKFIRTTAHGREAVLLNIIKQPTGSTVKIGNEVKERLLGLQIPADVRLENFYDQGDFILSSILSTRDSIFLGIVLAMFVILAFLRSWRIGLVIVFVVPATIACTYLCLLLLGLTINIMTLGGTAAAVGLIIDDSIVIIENIFAHFSRRAAHDRDQQTASDKERFAATASQAIAELMPAIVGSTASTIVIHIPLAFLGGVTGAFFASLSATMVCAMLISFFFSITLAPLLASFTVRAQDIEREISRERERHALSRWYESVLRRLLSVRWAVVPAGILLLAGTYAIFTALGSEFMPEMDEGTFVLDYNSPPGTSLNETNRMLMQVEDILLKIPEVETYSRRTGTQLGFFLTEPNNGDYLIKLRKDRSRGIDEVITEVRVKVEVAQPSLRIEFGQLMMDVIGDLTNNPSPVEIKLFGDDSRALHEQARRVKTLIESVPGVVDAFEGIVISGPSLIVHVDPFKAALAGLNSTDVAEQLKTIVRGNAETGIQKGEKIIAIRSRYPDGYRTDTDRLERLQLIGSKGVLVPLSTIATIERTGGQAEIHRDGLRQMIAVTARISGRDLGSTINAIKTKLAAGLHLQAGMPMEFGGVYQVQQESFRGLFLVAIAALLLVFIVLLFEFGEFAVPISVVAVTLLSLIGVVTALELSGATLNISSIVGIIMIIGIVAENAIFVVHEAHRGIGEGLSLEEALIEATRLRARPIFMTTLAAVLALLPLAIGLRGGAQMQQPLAIAVIGGFSTSSLLLFFALPMLYALLHRARENESW